MTYLILVNHKKHNNINISAIFQSILNRTAINLNIAKSLIIPASKRIPQAGKKRRDF
jgi:hypothetical protein